jgi:hypothetical protein
VNSLFTYRFEIADISPVHDVLLIFCATSRFDRDEFASVIDAELDSNLTPDELLIVVRRPAFESTRAILADDSEYSSTLTRLRKRVAVTLVGYDVGGKEADRVTIGEPNPNAKVTFDHFKRRALTYLFNLHHGFVESTSTYHFENPSGRHTERFIRLSNILVRGAEIAFIGFCTLPFVPTDAEVAYLDTPSLYAVLSAINEQRRSFENVQPILADNFSSYARIESYPFNRISTAIVVISASSSGSLALKLQDAHPFESEQITHLLFLGEDQSGSNLVCDLRYDKERNPAGIKEPHDVEPPHNCKMCKSGSHAIKLQGDQFEFAGPQQEPLVIRKADVPAKLGGLIGRLAGGRILSVGLGAVNGKQPRHFEIQTANLLAHPPFQERFNYVLRRSLPGKLGYVIAADDFSQSFAMAIASHSGLTGFVKHDQLDSDLASTDSAIVIAAAVIESGRSLLNISRDLRSIAPKAPLLYIVGFSKTTGESRREALDKTLAQTKNPFPYQFIEVERMILPRSDQNHAWQVERKLLLRPEVDDLISAELREHIDHRKSVLKTTTTALIDNLFLTNSPDREMRLQPGFVFWPEGLSSRSHTQADVFYTIASVLQHLRTNPLAEPEHSIKSNWFQQTILAPENFGRFNDDIIQASILRAARPFEMNFVDTPNESRELGRMVARIVDAAHKERGGAAAEFLLALATGRLRLCKEDTEAILKRETVGLPMIDFLLAVCSKELLS